MALSQHQLEKAKKAIDFLSSLPTRSGEGSGTSGSAFHPIPTQSSSSVNISESNSSNSIKTENGEYHYSISRG